MLLPGFFQYIILPSLQAMVNKEFIYLLYQLFAMALGNLIKRLRNAKDLKQSTVARRLGITQQAYSKIENGKVVNGYRLADRLRAMDSNEEELNAVSNIFTPPPPRKEGKK